MDTLAKDPEHFVRQQAAWSLEEVGTVRALSLVERATTDPDPDVARRAEEALAAIRARLERTRK